jgi:hypothetical protein
VIFRLGRLRFTVRSGCERTTPGLELRYALCVMRYALCGVPLGGVPLGGVPLGGVPLGG